MRFVLSASVFLHRGGRPVEAPWGDAPTLNEMAQVAQHGGSCDWLADEPDLYTLKTASPYDRIGYPGSR